MERLYEVLVNLDINHVVLRDYDFGVLSEGYGKDYLYSIDVSDIDTITVERSANGEYNVYLDMKDISGE